MVLEDAGAWGLQVWAVSLVGARNGLAAKAPTLALPEADLRPIATLPVGRQAFRLNLLSPAALSRRARLQHQFCRSQSRS
jgi:hypothetical protein